MTAQLIVFCNEHLEDVCRFANRANQREALGNKLYDLTRNKPDGWMVELFSDFAPYSFFWIEKDLQGRLGLIGGLIYNGDGSAPIFSVCLVPVDGWVIHT